MFFQEKKKKKSSHGAVLAAKRRFKTTLKSYDINSATGIQKDIKMNHFSHYRHVKQYRSTAILLKQVCNHYKRFFFRSLKIKSINDHFLILHRLNLRYFTYTSNTVSSEFSSLLVMVGRAERRQINNGFCWPVLVQYNLCTNFCDLIIFIAHRNVLTDITHHVILVLRKAVQDEPCQIWILT